MYNPKALFWDASVIWSLTLVWSSGSLSHPGQTTSTTKSLFPALGFCSEMYQSCSCTQASHPCSTRAVYHGNAKCLQPPTAAVARWLLMPATQGFGLVVLFLAGKGRPMLLFSSSWLMTLQCLSPGKNTKACCKSALQLRPASFSPKFWYWCPNASFSRWARFKTPLSALGLRHIH